MTLFLRVEEQLQKLNLTEEEVEQWLKIEKMQGEAEEAFAKRAQGIIEEEYNKTEYNNYHKMYRHWGNSKKLALQSSQGLDCFEPEIVEVKNKAPYFRDIQSREEKWNMEIIWKQFSIILGEETASLLLSIALKEYSQIEYAKAIGQPANTVGKRYRRAIQKIKKYFSKEAFLSMVRGY